MDFSVDITPTVGPTKDYIVAFGHLKLIRDRSNNVKKTVPSEMKKSTTSRLPRNTHITSSSKKITPKFSEQINLSGNTAGTSKETNSKIKPERSGEEKFKPSLIPRRKSNSKEIPTREPSFSAIKSITNRISPNIQQRNVQRVQLLNINPEFFPEIRSPPKSVNSARPIPTLGHIYRQDISNDTFTDWFLESVDEYREPFDNSIETTSTATDYSAAAYISTNNNEINNRNTSINLPTTENTSASLKIFKTTNENVSEWLSTELDHPTRDNESGYQSISKVSLNATYKPVLYDTNKKHEGYAILQNTIEKSSSNNVAAKESVSDNFLSTQPTVVIKKNNNSNNLGSLFTIPKINTDIKQNDFYPDFHKPLKYHSTPNPPRRRETKDKNPAASYVEYPSEVLQKTTNFETDGCDNLSSAIETGRGNLSSQWTLKRTMDSNSTVNGLDWSKLHSSQGTFKKMSTSGSWTSNGIDDKNGTLTSEKYSYHDYCYHYCWRKEVVKKNTDEQSLWDYRGRCKRCHKYRRTPNRKKLGQQFRYFRKRMTIGICRHRLNRVWKKTTEKWANWSKSPSKLRRFRMMNYLQKSIIWDNANVQTNIFVYHETGTDAVAREQKSAEITASLKLNSRSYKIDTSETLERNVKAQTKHANIGPSMFPFLRYSSNNTLVLGGRSYQSKLTSRNDLPNTGAQVKEIKSINTQCSNSQKNTFEEVLEISPEHKGIREIIDLTSMKLKKAVSQDAYTQVLIMCNNADTNIMFTPTNVNHPKKSSSLSQELMYYGIDAATDPIPSDKISLRSINLMTSKGMLQGLTHIETQVSPSVSLRNVSTGILAKDIYQDAKSSVITDTTVPCRRFDSTLVTSKGIVLSCTGTKITSVSSDNIPTASNFLRISRPITVNTAVSTFVNTKHMDCSTAQSLYRPKLEEIALDTDALEVMKSEKSTSQIHLENNLDIGLSGSNIVERTSFNCGSHHSQCSVSTDVQPDCNVAVTNTDVKPVSECTSMLDSDHSSSKNKIINNCQTQYSSYLKDGSWSPEGCARMRIGRSRLMSVRALLPDATDNAAQALPSKQSAETKTTSNQRMSASMLTSRFAFGDILQPIEMTLDAGNKFISEHVLTLNRAQVSSDNEAGTEPSHDNKPVAAQMSSKISQASKHSSEFSNKQRLREKSRSPTVIISSHLNASKWINECAHEDKDVHSIVTASASAVSESLQHATLVARSPNKLSAREIHQLSKVLVNSQPAINCVRANPYELISSTRLAKNVLLTENNANPVAAKENKSPTLTADKVTSDEVVVKDVKESILQVRPNLCDAATACDAFRHKSASVLTSHHVLPKNACCRGKAKGRNEMDCVFVYGRPRCVIHSHCMDVAIQMQPSGKENVHTKRSSSQRSIGLETSLPCQVCCHQKSEVIGEVLSPSVYKALYETTEHVMKEGSNSRCSKHSSNEWTFERVNEDFNRATMQMTSCLSPAPAQCCCMRCVQIGHTDNRSIQAIQNSFLHCPKCSAKLKELQKIDSDTIEDCVRSHLATSCRYYSNLLNMKLGRARDNFIRYLIPTFEEAIYPMTEPNYYSEACTMKPSGKQDENCEAKITTEKIHNVLNSSCILPPVISATDLRGHDKRDLQTVYYLLTAIEGRVRRLKNNLGN